LFLAPDTAENGGQLIARSQSGGHEQSFTDDSSIDAEALASAITSPHRLIYRTTPLTSAVHVSGTPGVSLRLSFSAPAAIVSAMLVDYRDGAAPQIVSRGWADPQNRDSIERTTPVVPGVSYTMRFELQPHDYIFAAGSRIGLMVLSSDQLFTLRPPAGTRLTLRPASSELLLPVVGGGDALTRAISR
jgi:X-Pro dipeptidyl-peptidase